MRALRNRRLHLVLVIVILGLGLAPATPATALSVPTVSTSSASGVTSTSAVVGGRIISSGGSVIRSQGIQWGLQAGSYGNRLVVPGGSNFSVTLKGLAPHTTYHVRAFAANRVGYGYGVDVSFTTAARRHC